MCMCVFYTLKMIISTHRALIKGACEKCSAMKTLVALLYGTETKHQWDRDREQASIGKYKCPVLNTLVRQKENKALHTANQHTWIVSQREKDHKRLTNKADKPYVKRFPEIGQ